MAMMNLKSLEAQSANKHPQKIALANESHEALAKTHEIHYTQRSAEVELTCAYYN
jgi:hypothetical protein